MKVRSTKSFALNIKTAQNQLCGNIELNYQIKLFFLQKMIPINVGIKMTDLQKRTQQTFQPPLSCHLDKIKINWKIWRIICLSKSRQGYNFVQSSVDCFTFWNVFVYTHEHILYVNPHGKALTWNSCSMTSVNAPQNSRLRLSLSAPPHRYRWLRLRTSALGGEKI